MSLQFSYTCDYYKERFKFYTGVDVEKMDEERVISQLLKFVESAFTFERSDGIYRVQHHGRIFYEQICNHLRCGHHRGQDLSD